jgi:hypothetical protein
VLRQLAAVALALVILAASASAAGSGCAATGAKVLKASHAARLYSVGTTLYGCLGSRRTRLGALKGTPASPATRVARYSLASPYAGIDTFEMGVDTFSSTVSTVDLGSGKTIATAPATSPQARAESFVSVRAMALNRDGVLAWIGERSAIGVSEPTYELHLLQAEDDSTVAAGTVPILTLALTRTRLSWTDATKSRHAIPLKP